MDSLEDSSGESQEYWLLAITAAQEACQETLFLDGESLFCGSDRDAFRMTSLGV